MNFKRKISTIIWDWNGTLLNDVDLCIASINKLLTSRDIQTIDKNKYHQYFDFPVKDYYEKIGFNFKNEPFEIPANQFIEEYFSGIDNVKLHSTAIDLLKHFKAKGFNQIILSAAEEVKLRELLHKFKITGFFQSVSGLSHDFATSKVELGIEMLRKLNIQVENACLIGDTLHDFEVSQAIGCKCILFDQGHHPNYRLRECGVPVISELADLKSILK